MPKQEWRVLAVDDEPNNLKLIQQILSKYYDLAFAPNGQIALDIVHKVQPDLILLDIMMPEMDGLEVCRNLKSNPETREIPVIFVTAKSDEFDEAKGLETGAVDYITKPISPPIVQARVKTHLTLKRMRQRVKDAFGRHVHPSVAEHILNDKIKTDGEMKIVTLLFSDLRNFTSFSEQNHPQVVFSRINEYYSAMTEIIHKSDGVVLQYVGDEIEAVFGAPFSDEFHADKAVQASLGMRQALIDLNARAKISGQDLFYHGIGIHTGPALAGVVGSKERQTYCMVGDTVNVASRVANLCKTYNTDILVSQESVTSLKHNYEMVSLPPTQVKGRSENVTVYRL